MEVSFNKEVLLALNKLDCLIEGDYATPYEIVELMSDELRDHLGNALYAFSANTDSLTYEQRVEGLSELTALSQGLGLYE